VTTLEIPESLFKRLQKHAEPLVDTHTTVLERILNDYESRRNAESEQADESPEEKLLKQIFSQPGRTGDRKASEPRDPMLDSEILEFTPGAPPDLRHADVHVARFAGRTAFGWNKLVHEAHLEAMSRLGSIEALRNVTKSNFMVGRASSEDTKRGYRHVPGMNISIQNVDAAHAWSNTLRLARHLRVEVQVEFEWKQKADALHPGRKGRLTWKPQ
jgi:hypothetical protein